MSSMIVAGLIGLVSGALGSLVAPWVHWQIELKRTRREERKQKLKQWRGYVSTFSHPSIRDGLASDADFAAIQPHLSPSTHELVLDWVAKRDDKLRVTVQGQILRDLLELERRWDL